MLMKKMGNKYPSTVVAFVILFLGIIFLAPFAIHAGLPPLHVVKWAALAAFPYAIGMALYSWAFVKGEISLTAPLYNTSVFFIFIFAVLLLGETFTLFKLAGILVLFYGAAFLQGHHNFIKSMRKLVTNKACLAMLLSAFFMACGRVIDRYVVMDFSFLVYGFYIELFGAFFVFLILALKREVKYVKTAFTKYFSGTLYMGVVNIAAYMMILLSLTYIEVSIAEPLTLFAPLVTVLLGKYIFHEKIKARLSGTLIMIAGLVLLFF